MNYAGQGITLLTKNHGSVIVKLDKADYTRLLGAGELKGLHVSPHGQFLYIKNQGKKYLHRLIMDPPKGLVVDHINRDPSDNRRENLRVVTIQQNLRNQFRPNNTSGTTGVSWDKRCSKWSARLRHNGKYLSLGMFKDIKDAVTARKKAEKELWGMA